MKLKKILTSAAAITAAALLLTGCTGSNSDNPDGGKGKNDENIKYLTVSDFTSGSEELRDVENISAFYSRFGNESSSGLLEEAVAASTASYLDNTAYSYYFITDWWGEKDDYSNKGFQNFSNYVSDSLMEEIKTANKDKNKDPLGAKYFFHQPKANTEAGYGPSQECFDTWEPLKCMAPYPTESLNIVSINAHRAIVEVKAEYTVYLVDEFGDSRNQNITYSATLELENNKKLTNIKEQPFFTVTKISEGGYTYGEPTEPTINSEE